MKYTVLSVLFFITFVTNPIWAEGGIEGSSTRLNPGAKIILEWNGYTFDSSDNLIGYDNYSIMVFPHLDTTNTNPYAYDYNIIYLTHFNINQWVDKSVLATTGNLLATSDNAMARELSRNMLGTFSYNGTLIFIQDIHDSFLRIINNSVQNALLVYLGAQTFQMANGSIRELPVFELIELFSDTISQATRVFNSAFEAGKYKEGDGYEYSEIGDRIFARDIVTKSELYELIGGKWISLIEN
jgi:hypothetical protein